MTPTLLGRWQTRWFLTAIVGLPITLTFALGLLGTGTSWHFIYILGYMALFGTGWDLVYQYLQSFRWDHDWPGILQLLAGIWEGLVLGVMIMTIGLPGIPQPLVLSHAVLHYSLVWLGIYTASQTLMRVLFPHWRFQGGQFWK